MPKNSILARENRVMIDSVKGDIKDIKTHIENIYTKIDKSYNHLSSRLPQWASILFMILTAVLGAMIGRGV